MMSTARLSLLGAAAALAVCLASCLPGAAEAFVAPNPVRPTPSTPLLEHADAGEVAEGATAPWSAALGVASLLALGAAAGARSMLSARKGNAQSAPVVVACRAASLASIQKKTPAQLVQEGKFAGGLIGGESAFKGQIYNFDPMGFSTRQPEFLPWYREAELKHGRVAMLAWVGLVVPDFVRIPGPEEYYGVKNVVEAHNVFVGKNNLGPMFQIFAFCGLVEVLGTLAKCQQTEGLTLDNAGDYKLGLNFLPKDPEKVKEMKLKELKNGRLAMLAFGGAITQAVLTGNGFPWLYNEAVGESKAAPLASSVPAAGGRACGGNRVAMRAEVDPDQVGAYKMSKAVPFLPVSPALEGYVGEEDGFDPMGFSLAFDIRWLREAELKHARVCMLATVGWITTDLGVRVPGEPFANVSTLEAHNAMVRFGNMQQLLIWIGFFEVFGFLAINKMCEGETDRAPGDFGIRTWYPKDEAGQYQMQLKELRNGRLAMLAFSGIVTVAAFTGKTWPFLDALPESAQARTTGGALCGSSTAAASPRGAAVACMAKPVSRSLPFLPKPKNLEGWAGCEAEFDPLGFSDNFDMKWLREAELKHGRVCMLATVGFVVQQWACEGPNGAAGWPTEPDQVKVLSDPFALGQLGTVIAVAGWIESSSNDGKMTMLDMFEDPKRVPGDLHFGDNFLKGKPEDYVYNMKLKELNNGRLAMFGWLGMIHHNFVVNGPLFPMVPDGWKGPQGTWALEGDSAGTNWLLKDQLLCQAGLGGASGSTCL